MEVKINSNCKIWNDLIKEILKSNQFVANRSNKADSQLLQTHGMRKHINESII